MSSLKETAMQLMKPAPSGFGKSLIEEAAARASKARMDKAVYDVGNVQATIDNSIKQIAWFTYLKSKAEAQLAAIEAGQFSYNMADKIVYNDDELNDYSDPNQFGL